MIENHQDGLDCSLEHVRIRCFVGNDKYQEIVVYNDFLKYISKVDNDPVVWKFKQITKHEGLLTP